MADPTTSTAHPKSKKSTASTSTFSAEAAKSFPKFDIPKFEVPTMEIPSTFHELAEQTLAQAKEAYEKVKTATEQVSNVVEDIYSTTAKGYSAYGIRLIETARLNSNAAFDLYGELLAAKSYSEVVEKSASYMRNQFDTLMTQGKELSEQAQKICADTISPLQKNFSNSTKMA